MVLVSISNQGANTRLERYEIDGRTLKTHESVYPRPSPEAVEHFRRSPMTCQRFGFQSPIEAIARGFSFKTRGAPDGDR